MSWRDELQPASFRGVPFKVVGSERGGGRRVVRHEYPQRNAPQQEDLGRRTRTFKLEAFIVGDDYFAARDALLDALEGFGPGELVHPYFGRVRVVLAGAFTLRETSDEGRVARFALEFEEAPESVVDLVSAPDAFAQVQTSAAAASTAVGADFLARFNTAGQPSSSLTSLVAVVQSATAAITAALSPVVGATQNLAGLKQQMDAISVGALNLVLAPAQLVSSLAAAVAALAAPSLSPRLGLDALLSAYGFTPSTARPAATTPTRTTEQANYDAVQRLFQRQVLVQAALVAPAQSYESYDDAAGVRDAITAKLDDQLLTAGDESWPALMQLRADLVRAVPDPTSDLPRLVQLTPPAVVPSLVLAYRTYGDLALELDLVARNGVQRPGFIRGGVALEVLSSA